MMGRVNSVMWHPPPLDGPEDALLQTKNISKSFSGVRVLNGISVRVAAGEVHAIMGENGAGKSTLLKILAGIHLPDSGEVRLAGAMLRLGSAHAALRAGIAMIYQELQPFLDLSIAENIFMGQEPCSRYCRWIDKVAMHRQSGELLASLGLDVSPQCRLRDLRVAEMQVVEIARALAHRARVLLMDEPTSALSERETQALFRIVADLRQRGTSIVYISHKFEEVFRLADRVTVLRDGALVATRPAGTLDRETLIRLMVGRSLEQSPPRTASRNKDVALSVSGLERAGHFRNVTFEVRRGEVLGLAGLMGAGRTGVVNAIYGLEPADSGEIRVDGRVVRIKTVRDALRAGIGLVTEDRNAFGLIPAFRVQSNLTLAALRRWCRKGFIDRAAEKRVADEQIQSLSIRAARNQFVQFLSGGNQQKVVLGRTLLGEPQILLLDEPTRGIDIAAKAEVHALIRQIAQSGKAVVLVSSELPELMLLSDRILVMRQGTVRAELDGQTATAEQILELAMPE